MIRTTDLDHLTSLVRRDVKERRRRYEQPAAVAKRERYFAANPDGRDVDARAIALGDDLLSRLDSIDEDAVVVVIPDDVAIRFLSRAEGLGERDTEIARLAVLIDAATFETP